MLTIGAEAHQDADHLRHALEDRVVQRHVAVTCGRLPIYQLGAEAQDGFRLVQVTGAYGFDQAGDGDAVDEGLELRPTLKNVAARENQLGVVERKLRPIGNRDKSGSPRCGIRLASDKSIKQLSGLAFELVQAGFFDKMEGR
jgi:hypothetical protein